MTNPKDVLGNQHSDYRCTPLTHYVMPPAIIPTEFYRAIHSLHLGCKNLRTGILQNPIADTCESNLAVVLSHRQKSIPVCHRYSIFQNQLLHYAVNNVYLMGWYRTTQWCA